MLEVDTLKLKEMRHVCLCAGIVLREGEREGGGRGDRDFLEMLAHYNTIPCMCTHIV